MWRLFAHLWLLFLSIVVTSCIGSRYYGELILPDGYLATHARERLLQMLPQKVKASAVVRIEVVFPGGTVKVLSRLADTPDPPLTLDAVPTPSLAALYLGLDKSVRGSEMDLLIPLADGQRVPITVLHEPDGAVLLQQGNAYAAGSLLDSTVSPSDMKSRYGIAPSDFGEARWTPAHYAALDLALKLLGDEERALVAHVPIVREHGPLPLLVAAKLREHVAAMYTRRRGQPRIELYDSLLSEDDKLFCGSPEAPLPRSVWAILHEYGHVIADAARADAIRHVITSVDSYARLEDRLAEQRPGPTEGTFLVTADEKQALGEKQALAESAIDRADWMGKSGPVLRAYRWARRYSNGPTPYGRTSLDESFAEAFAMFHVDRAALRRVDPKTCDWFERGGHIKAISD